MSGLLVDVEGPQGAVVQVDGASRPSVWTAADDQKLAPSGVHAPVFVSYATEDRDRLIRPLVDWLRASGLSVWCDWLSIRGGAAWEREIEAGLHRCSVLLAALTPRTVCQVRQWVEYEHKRARLRYFVPVVPVILDDCSPPEHLADLQCRRLLPMGFTPNGTAVYRPDELRAKPSLTCAEHSPSGAASGRAARARPTARS